MADFKITLESVWNNDGVFEELNVITSQPTKPTSHKPVIGSKILKKSRRSSKEKKSNQKSPMKKKAKDTNSEDSYSDIDDGDDDDDMTHD